MGSAEESGTAAAKPLNPKATTVPPTTAATVPPLAMAPAASQEVSAMPPYPDWQAYYASGAAAAAAAAASPAAFFPATAWGGQLITQYGTPIAYSPMYSHAALYGAHPSVSMGTPYPNLELEGRPSDGKEQDPGRKSKGAAPGKSGDGGKVTSGSADDDATQSAESGSEGSSATRDGSTDPQDSYVARKRTLSDTFAEGETAQAGGQYSSTASESSHSGRVAKLPVSAPGRATLPGPTTNLNMGMDLWNAPHAGAGPVKVGPNSVNIAPSMAGREGFMPEHQWMQMDERELKRQRRKQSNRESARRSRLRKQQECEDLARKVAELNGENNSLRVELEKIKKDYKELEAENVSIVEKLESINPDLPKEEELKRLYRHGASSASEGINGNPSSMPSVGEGSRYVHQSPVGPS